VCVTPFVEGDPVETPWSHLNPACLPILNAVKEARGSSRPLCAEWAPPPGRPPLEVSPELSPPLSP
jgi:hypothetical protein